jgi:hypothetical protein
MQNGYFGGTFIRPRIHSRLAAFLYHLQLLAMIDELPL